MAKIIEIPADKPEETAPATAPTAAAEPFEDGVYFGLAETPYHADMALGSTDIRRLFYSPAEWWWHSDLNPHKPEDTETSFKIFGKAVHKYVLEGSAAFKAEYEREYDGADMLVVMDDLKRWLGERGQKCPVKKADAIELALAIDPTVKIKDAIQADADKRGVHLLKPDVYDRIVISGSLIAQAPDLETAFAGGQPEVSVFWTEEVDGQPVRCKARFDYLKVRGIGDLKSTANSKQMDFPALCRIRFAERRMDMQAAHYMRAREVLARLVAEDKVFGNVNTDWIRQVAAQRDFGMAFVFFQSDGAPSTWSTSISPDNPILEIAGDHRALALRKFVQNRKEHGENMWLHHEPMRELDSSELPAWWGRR